MTTNNNNINNIESLELEQMRQQFEMLKQHLNEHHNIKEEQLLKAVSNDLNKKIRKDYFCIAACAIAFILEIALIFQGRFTPTNGLLCVLFSIIVYRLIEDIKRIKEIFKTSQMNVVEAQTEIATYYKKFTCSTKRTIGGIIGGLVTFVILHIINGKSFSELFELNENNTIMLSAIAICAVIVAYGSWMTKQKSSRFIQQIEELDELKKM